MKEIYTPMERILIEGAQAVQEKEISTAELVAAAIKSKNDTAITLLLDLMLLEAEAAVGLMDGLPVENL